MCFRFEDDTLDCSDGLRADVPLNVVELDGNHLTPVFLQLGVEGTAAAGLPLSATLGTGKFVVGSEAQVQALAEAIVAWLKGSTGAESSGTRGARILPNGVIDV